jgi:hypothetical protein
MNELVVTRGADGSLVYGHGFAPAPPPLEEK